MNKLMAIRLEYGEPFVDVVRGFAEMGYSRRATAAVLDLNLSYFRQLLVRFDLGRHFLPQSQMRRECKGAGTGCPKGTSRPRAAVYSNDQLLAEVRRLPSYSLSRHLGTVNVSTVQARFGSWRNARVLAFAQTPGGVSL